MRTCLPSFSAGFAGAVAKKFSVRGAAEIGRLALVENLPTYPNAHSHRSRAYRESTVVDEYGAGVEHG